MISIVSSIVYSFIRILIMNTKNDLILEVHDIYLLHL